MVASSWPSGWTIRPATLDDVELAVNMFNARSRKFYGENQSTVEEMAGWWKSSRLDLFLDTRIVLDQRGRMMGWSHTGNPGDPYVCITCGAIVHPEVEGNQELWDGLYSWALERAWEYISLAPRDAKVIAVESAMEVDPARRLAVERAGFEMVRVANRMRIDLEDNPCEPAFPNGIHVRTADIEADLRSVVAADVEAFRDHWGHVERPFEEEVEVWQDYIQSEGEMLDPALWFLAAEGDEIVGFSVCSGHIADDLTRGYVDGLCVRPAWRKRGIALALLHHSFAELHRRGRTAVELDMDSENLTGALRLYERAGMRVVRRTLSYEKVLRDGRDLVTRELTT